MNVTFVSSLGRQKLFPILIRLSKPERKGIVCRTMRYSQVAF
jgi:hypothetical protein